MNTSIYDKTEKGREEIDTRKYQVPPKLRTLLVMIDGRRPLDGLLKNLAGLGLNQDSVKQLIDAQYITLVSGGSTETAIPAAPAARPPSSARARALARGRGAAPKMADAAAPQPAPADEAQRLRAIYEFYNHTVAHTIGLRGFMLQLKVDKAASIDDFRALRRPYLEAVFKAKGRDMALRLRDRLDRLLGGAPELEDVALPDA
jgi:hypothetical protein